MSSHSSIVGGSTAARLLACPGSHQALMSLPPTADAPSEYAEEGTAMHEVMTDLMRWRQMSVQGYDFVPFRVRSQSAERRRNVLAQPRVQFAVLNHAVDLRGDGTGIIRVKRQSYTVIFGNAGGFRIFGNQ